MFTLLARFFWFIAITQFRLRCLLSLTCVLVCKAFGRSPIDAYSMSVRCYLRYKISFIPFVFSSWRHISITLYLLAWFACSSCRCIVIMLDAHVDLCGLSW